MEEAMTQEVAEQTPAPIGAGDGGVTYVPREVQMPNMGRPQQREQSEQPASTEKGQGQGQTRTVPYERLEAVSRQNQELRRQMQELNDRFEVLQNPQRTAQELQAKKAAAQEFWKDPHAYVEKSKEELAKQFQQVQAEAADLGQYRVQLAELRSSPSFTPELENAMASVIQQHGLQRLGRVAAMELSYRAVTGKQWGEWKSDNYSTRSLKERLARPGTGGGAGNVKGAMTPDEFNAVPPEEYEKNPTKYNKQLEAYMKSLG